MFARGRDASLGELLADVGVFGHGRIKARSGQAGNLTLRRKKRPQPGELRPLGLLGCAESGQELAHTLTGEASSINKWEHSAIRQVDVTQTRRS